MPATPVSLRLDDKTRARLAAEAARLDRPAAQVATRAIRSWLDAQDSLRRQVDAAVDEANEGVFVSSEAVGAWMDSWDTEHEAPLPEADISPGDGSR